MVSCGNNMWPPTDDVLDSGMIPPAGGAVYAVLLVTVELSTKVIDVEEQLRSTLLHKMRHAAQWLVSLFCGWSRYSTISGKYLLIIAWAVSLLPLLSGVFTEIRLHNSLSPADTFSDEFWRNVHADLSRIKEFLTGLYNSVFHKVLLE